MNRNRCIQLAAGRLAAAAVATALLAGCTTFPGQSDIAAFGTATEVLATAGNNTYAASVAISQTRAEEEGALGYVDNPHSFPPDYAAFPTFPDDHWAVRRAILGAIGDYGKSLAAIGEPGAADSAATSSSELAAAVLKAVNAGQPATGAVPAVISGAVRLGTNAYLSTRIRTVMHQTHPVLVKAALLLENDFALLADVQKIHADGLTKTRAEMLARLRRDKRNSSLQLNAAYHQSVQQEKDIARTLRTAKAISGTLNKLVKAHAKLMNSQDDDRALVEFLVSTKEIATGLSALRS